MGDDEDPAVPATSSADGGEEHAPESQDHRPGRAWAAGAGLAVVLALVAAGVIMGRGNRATVPPSPRHAPAPVTATVPATASSGPRSPGVRLEVSVPAGTPATVVEQVVGVLAARLQGAPGVSVARQGAGVVVALPSSSNAQALLNLVQEPGTFEVRPVLGVSGIATATPTAADDPAQPVVLAGLGPGATETFSLGPATLTGTAVQSAGAAPAGDGSWAIDLTFTPEATTVWTHFTGQLACATGAGRQFALVLDGRVASAPSVAPDVKCGAGIATGATVVQDGFTQAEAQEFAAVLASGPLPVPISVVAGAP